MCRRTLRVMLDRSIQMFQLVVSEFSNDILQQGKTRMLGGKLSHLFELAA